MTPITAPPANASSASTREFTALQRFDTTARASMARLLASGAQPSQADRDRCEARLAEVEARADELEQAIDRLLGPRGDVGGTGGWSREAAIDKLREVIALLLALLRDCEHALPAMETDRIKRRLENFQRQLGDAVQFHEWLAADLKQAVAHLVKALDAAGYLFIPALRTLVPEG